MKIETSIDKSGFKGVFMRAGGVFLALSFLAGFAHAQASSRLIRGESNHQPLSVEEAVAGVLPGSIVVIGENHGLKTDQNQQLQVLQALRKKGLVVAVGLEFLEARFQPQVDEYRAGNLSEAAFLKKISWGSPSFDFYRDQAQFPLLSEGAETVALNAPRTLADRIAKVGLAGLSTLEKNELPPNFHVGRDSYKARFLVTMGSHVPSPAQADNYFAAQSTWDDTMAWTAVEYMRTHPQQVLAIVVGEFHVQYGGGLPDRLRARGSFPVTSFSLINTQNMSAADEESEIIPSPTEGPRADFLWLAPAL